MAGPTLFQVRRTSVADREANTVTLPNVGEVGVNLTDGRMWVANSTGPFEVGANTKTCRVSNNFFVGNSTVNVTANSSQINTGFIQVVTAAYVGDNVDITTAGLFLGNSTVNVIANSTILKLANSTVNTALRVPTSGQYTATNYFLHANGQWIQISAGGAGVTRVYQSYVATADQTVYTVSGGYTVDQIEVYENGVHLANTEYTQNGSTVTFLVGSLVGAIVEIAGYKDINISEIVPEPAGANTEVQYNDSLTTNASAGFTFNKDTNSVFIGNTLVVGVNTINSTNYNGTANNALYLGGVAAAGYVVDADLDAYQTEAGLSANVATLTSNNALYLGGTLAADYQTEAGLSANVATLTSNNTLYLGGTLAADYQTEAGLSANVATLASNSTTYIPSTNGLVSNSTGVWITANAGLLTNTTGLHVKANTGIVANATGVFVNAAYIATIDANNTSFLGGVAAAGYVVDADLNAYQTEAGLSANVATLTSNNSLYLGGVVAADYQTEAGLAANVAILDANNTTYIGGADFGNTSGVYPVSNSSGTALGDATHRWVITANSSTLTGSLTSDSVNAVTSVNSALIKVGTAFIANTTGAYHTGVVNAATHSVGTSWTANSTLVNANALNCVNQINTATLFVTTSANISSAVINSSGGFHTGILNAASHSVGTSWTANSTLVNANALNCVNQVNTATLYCSTTANVGTVQINTTALDVGATIVNSSMITVGAGSIISSNVQTNPQAGTTYTLQATDSGKAIICSSGSAVTVTVPAGLPVGFRCQVVQMGAGQVTMSNTGQTGALLFSRTAAFAITAQYGSACVFEATANNYLIDGLI